MPPVTGVGRQRQIAAKYSADAGIRHLSTNARAKIGSQPYGESLSEYPIAVRE
jgi:hypothetical protein